MPLSPFILLIELVEVEKGENRKRKAGIISLENFQTMQQHLVQCVVRFLLKS